MLTGSQGAQQHTQVRSVQAVAQLRALLRQEGGDALQQRRGGALAQHALVRAPHHMHALYVLGFRGLEFLGFRLGRMH